MKYCNNCEQMVEPQKEFSALWFIFLLILGIVPGVIYLIYYLLKSKKCPMCSSTNWGVKPSGTSKK